MKKDITRYEDLYVVFDSIAADMIQRSEECMENGQLLMATAYNDVKRAVFDIWSDYEWEQAQKERKAERRESLAVIWREIKNLCTV